MQTGPPRGEQTGGRREEKEEEEEEQKGGVEARKQRATRRKRRMKLPRDAEGHRTRDQRRNEAAKRMTMMMTVRKRLPRTREEVQPTRGKEVRAEEVTMKTARRRKEARGGKEERKEERRKKTARARKETAKEKTRRTRRRRRRTTGRMLHTARICEKKSLLSFRKYKFGVLGDSDHLFSLNSSTVYPADGPLVTHKMAPKTISSRKQKLWNFIKN